MIVMKNYLKQHNTKCITEVFKVNLNSSITHLEKNEQAGKEYVWVTVPNVVIVNKSFRRFYVGCVLTRNPFPFLQERLELLNKQRR